MPDSVNPEPVFEEEAPAPAAASPAKPPPTEEQRAALRLEKLKTEKEEDRTKRRTDEIKALTDAHLANVLAAHALWPTPAKPFEDMTETEQQNWQTKRKDIDQANRAYHLAVKRTCAAHRSEDVTLARVRAEEAAAKEAA